MARSIFSFLLLLGPAMCADGLAVTFSDVTFQAGINHVHYVTAPVQDAHQTYMSGGVAAGDFDNDGWVDLYFTRLDDSDLLYRNLGDGNFADVTGTAFGANHLSAVQTNGAAWGDIDRDGDLDLYVTSIFANRYHLFINDGNGAFTEEAASRGADVFGADMHFGFSPSFGDYDRDGYLDLYVTEWRQDAQNPGEALQNSRLLRNAGASAPGHFIDVTQQAGVALDDRAPLITNVDSQSFAARFTDLDGDGHTDLAISADHQTSTLFWNNGDGTFTDGTFAAGVGTDKFGMGNAIGDFDLDGDLDWFVTSIYDQPLAFQDGNRLYQNNGDRTFTDATDAAGVRDGDWGWGAAMFDFDNDGDLDILEANGQDFDYVPANFTSAGYEDDPVILWENDGTGVFTEIASSVGLSDARSGKGVLTFDYDRDGDLDVVITNNGDTPVLYRNDGGNNNDWLRIETQGTLSSPEGSGALITVTEEPGGQSQLWEVTASSHFLGQSETAAYFGFGDGTAPIHQVSIQWPSGVRQVFENVDRNSVLVALEPFGDYDASGTVDATDYAVWQATFGQQVLAGSGADGNGDGMIDAADYAIWRDHLGLSFASTAGAAHALPEPNSGWFLFGMLVLRRRTKWFC